MSDENHIEENMIGDAENDDDEFSINEEDIVAVYDLDGNDVLPHEEDEDIDVSGPESDVYTGHKESVFCVCGDPLRRGLVVSGGQDDTAYCWDARDTTHPGQKLKGNHSDSVSHVSYSADGHYICTADMGGVVNIWQVEGDGAAASQPPNITRLRHYDMELTPNDARCIHWIAWHPSPGTSVLLSGSNESVWMWRVPSDECRVFTHGAEGAATAGRVLPDGRRLFAGHERGDMRCWDLKSTNTIYLIDVNKGSHTDSVTCMATHQSSPILITGSLDGTVKVVNYDQGKVMSTFTPAAATNTDATSGSEEESSTEVEVAVEDVAFSPSQSHLACSVSNNGIITVWDLNTCMARHSIRHHCCVTSLQWDVAPQARPYVLTGDVEGVVSVWDVRSGRLVTSYTHHAHSHVLDLTLIHTPPNSKKLVTASDDGSCRVFDITDI